MPVPFQPRLEALEDRCLPSAVNFAAEPVLPVIDAGMKAHLRGVLANGLRSGNRLNTFSKIGDSITHSQSFLVAIGAPTFNPANPALIGNYSYLADTLLYFRSSPVDALGANSFNHQSFAAFPGYTSSNALSTLYGELASTRPGFTLIMLGSNDVVLEANPAGFRGQLTAIVNQVLAFGSVPVVSTIPDSFYAGGIFEDRVIAYNQVIAEVAETSNVPLWNYWLAMQSLPLKGISPDGVHPSASPYGSGRFDDVSLLFGYNLRNLTAIQVLDKLQKVLLQDAPSDYVNIPPSADAVAYVTALYRGLLERKPQPEEVLYWGGLLMNGVGKQAIASDIWQSAEHRGLQVDQYYAAYLKRSGETFGRTYWINHFLIGANETEIQREFLTSGEYASSHPDAGGFITGLYLDVLGEKPDAIGRLTWDQRLQQTGSRAEAAVGFLTSARKSEEITADSYRGLLQRLPSAGELTAFRDGLLSGLFNERTSAVVILTSTEFVDKSRV